MVEFWSFCGVFGFGFWSLTEWRLCERGVDLVSLLYGKTYSVKS